MSDVAQNRRVETFPDEFSGSRKRLVVVSSDSTYSESLRSHLASGFDVLMARNAGEAAAKAFAVHVDLVVVDLGKPVLGIPALSRMRDLSDPPIICGLAPVDDTSAQAKFDYDFVLARPDTGANLPDRIRFILAKKDS